MREHAPKHQIPMKDLNDRLPYEKTYAWVMAEPKPLSQPIPYKHPSGAVIWVRLNADNVPQRFGELVSVE